jgi:hypothetical protein
LDADLKAWHRGDDQRLRIGILGPITIEGSGPCPRLRCGFLTELIVFLSACGVRGATADEVHDALWPASPATPSSRRVAVGRARAWLGVDALGRHWLPKMAADCRYRLLDGYLLDWDLFRQLRIRGQTGGQAGAADLERALDLVRGVPLDDAGYRSNGARDPYHWLPVSGISPHLLVAAVHDTAHQLVMHHLDGGDIPTAWWAAGRAWLAEPDPPDGSWLDLMRVCAAAGHTGELHALTDQLVRTRGLEVPEDLPPATYRVIDNLIRQDPGLRQGDPVVDRRDPQCRPVRQTGGRDSPAEATVDERPRRLSWRRAVRSGGGRSGPGDRV